MARSTSQLLPPRVPFVLLDSGVLTREAYRSLQQLADLAARVAAIEEETMTSQCVIESKYAEAAETTQYTCPANSRVVLENFSGHNTSGGAITITVKIVPSGAPADADYTVAYSSVAAGTSYTFAGLVDQTLEPGDYISTLASGATSITIRASGRVIPTT